MCTGGGGRCRGGGIIEISFANVVRVGVPIGLCEGVDCICNGAITGDGRGDVPVVGVIGGDNVDGVPGGVHNDNEENSDEVEPSGDNGDCPVVYPGIASG